MTEVKRTKLPYAGPEVMAESARRTDPFTGAKQERLQHAMDGLSFASRWKNSRKARDQASRDARSVPGLEQHLFGEQLP